MAVGVVNLGEVTAQGNVRLPELPDGSVWDLEDRLTGAQYRWTREALSADGLYVRLEPGNAHLLLFAGA